MICLRLSFSIFCSLEVLPCSFRKKDIHVVIKNNHVGVRGEKTSSKIHGVNAADLGCTVHNTVLRKMHSVWAF